MNDWPIEEMKQELLKLARIGRSGADGPRPLDFLDSCPTLLSATPAVLGESGLIEDRLQGLALLLEHVAFDVTSNKGDRVRAFGDLLGLTQLESEKIREIYDKFVGRGKPDSFVRYSRGVRQILAADHFGRGIEWTKDKEDAWVTAFVDELCTYLDDQDGKLTNLARDLGRLPRSTPQSLQQAESGQPNEKRLSAPQLTLSSALPVAVPPLQQNPTSSANVVQSDATTGDPDNDPPQKRSRPHLALIGAITAAVVALVAAGTAEIVAVDTPSPAPKTDNTGAASADPGNTTRALAVASSWPYITGCPSLAQVAMPPGMGRIQDFHAVTDVRPTLAASGAGSWSRGMLYLDLSTVNGQSVHIQNILPHRTRLDLASPAWIYTPDDGCGPPLSNRAFSFDLDAPSFKDMGVAYSNSSSPPAGVVPPTAPLGPGFIISGAEHALIEVDASSCHGNYEWNLDIQYVVTGSDKVEHYLEGPFQSYGVANNTDVYRGHQDPTGGIQIDDVSKSTGSAQC